MRQKDDISFVQALNNLVIGKMTVEDIRLIKSRETSDGDVPIEAIRLYKTNIDVDTYNEIRIRKMEGDLFKHHAHDAIAGKLSKKMRKSKLKAMKGMPKHQTYGLQNVLNLKVGIRYIITANIDIEDGLVNGATGTLK